MINFEATAQVQARKRAFTCRESGFDSRRLEADNFSSKSAAQQTVDVVAGVGMKTRIVNFFASEMKENI